MTKKKQSSKFEAFFDIKRVSDERGRWIVEGYATTADLDVDDGYITEEALRGAENDLLKYSTLLYNHDRDNELGKVLETKYIPEQRALWIKAMISKTASDVWQKIKEGVLNKFSINGRALEWSETKIKGLDKLVTMIKSLTLFEASLVTVPADASARTLAHYVERSIKNHNSKEDISMELKKKEISRETKDVGRDKERVEGLIDSIEDALNVEDMETHAQAMRSVLDFLKSLLATDYNTPEGTDSERAAGNLKALVDEAVAGPIGELANQVTTLAEAVQGYVEKTREEIVEKAAGDKKEEVKEVKEEKKVEKAVEEKKEEVKEEKKADEHSIELKRMSDSISSLEKLVKENMPVRRAPGAEEHKDDKRDQKEKENDITKSKEFQDKEGVDPVGRLKMLFNNATPQT